MSEEVIEKSWFSRLGDSIKGIVGGFVLILAAIFMLFWNEGRAVDRTKTLEEGQGLTVSVESAKINPANNGKLVHFSGKIDTNDKLNDEYLGISIEKALKLERKAEFYQWVEQKHESTEKKAGGKTVTRISYSYKKEWVSKPVDSASFHDQGKYINTVALNMAEPNKSWRPELSTVGAYELDKDQISGLGEEVPLTIDSKTYKMPVETVEQISLPSLESEASGTQAVPNAQVQPNAAMPSAVNTQAQPNAAAVPNAVNTQAQPNAAAMPNAENALPGAINTQAQPNAASAVGSAPVGPEAVNAESGAEQTVLPYTVMENVIYISRTPNSPAVGDVRISYTYDKCGGDVTVVAQQNDNKVADYKLKKGSIFLTSNGVKTIEDMYAAAHSANAMTTWFLRLLGFLLMMAGFNLIFKPISVLADVIPLFGDIAEAGLGAISGLLAFGLSFVVIAVSWVFVRPVLGVTLLVIAAVSLVFMVKKLFAARAKRSAAPAPEPAPAPAA